MPTTLPSPADRDRFRFVAVDATGAVWEWLDDEVIWAPVPGETRARDPEPGHGVLH